MALLPTRHVSWGKLLPVSAPVSPVYAKGEGELSDLLSFTSELGPQRGLRSSLSGATHSR